ncbi:hypothetical protein OIU84_009513 [Salix udensis]|uniref:RAB6-interacting golgin n=1 Tax=Salix udensis TaxID=889485 RepID=A0AAD6JRK3_9ROSI|nr:hypothetical protein OIU84_009513 [Salix udensis]
MTTQKPISEQQMSQMQIKSKNSGVISNYNESPLLRDDKDDEISRSALAVFRAKEEEIEKRKMEVRDKVHAHLGRAEEATKRLAEIREELEALTDPMRKEVSMVLVRRRRENTKKPLKLFNDKSKEKAQLVSKLVELVGESEKLRMKKLEELSRNIETLP